VGAAVSAHGLGLRRLLMGLPLSQRSDAACGLELADLNRHLAAVSALMPQIYGRSESCMQAQMELDAIIDLEGPCSIECKRASLLFALSREKELGDHFELSLRSPVDMSTEDLSFAVDVRTRVLPFIFPRFLRNMCQTPDSFVVLSCVMAEMWEGETFGNYGPREGAHHETPEAVL